MDDKTYILVADDDREIAEIVKNALEGEGFCADTASDGEETLKMLKSGKYKLAILDIMMPKMNGIEATVLIRQISNIPILMLSAKAEESDKIIGLSTGADDYLTKPFLKGELTARVRSLLRRYTRLGSETQHEDANIVSYFDITLDLGGYRCYVRDSEIKLTATEFRILKMLMKRPGRVFSAEEIYERCWDSDAYAVENTVMIHISRLRKKLEINPSKPEYIKVVWGVGYKIEKE